MALKAKIDKATYEALKPDLKAEYKAEGEDFVLDVEELDFLPGVVSMKDALARAKQNEVIEHGKTKAKLKTVEDRVVELEEGDKTRTNDTKAIEDRWKRKVSETEAEWKLRVEARERQLAELLVDNEALRIANEISTEPDVILPHIQKRLKADLTGDKPVTVVLDDKGEPSTKNLDDLRKELLANKKFATIIVASKASGSGARQSNGSGGATPQTKPFKDLSEAERTSWAASDADGFAKAAEAHQLATRKY